MGIVSSIKTWPVSVAMATGIAIGSAGTYQVTSEKYDPNATIQTASDSMDVKKNVVIRPVAAYDMTGKIAVGDMVRLVVFKNDVIVYEQKQDIVNAPLPPNDGFTATARLYIYEDRIAPMPEEEVIK